ncbi:signal recognition particle-docking protein FtsY [Enterovirga rhinocerotis]|uniref:Signal recognition particle receptor FtsY n=1 Tax=Enterovirga rhinocerotis TaxID=1339210 RepID=A0A4R7C4V8_9HYPH|nr:signal recognition particle-docking protein FtsY [Enterovirga rhinocerotis]TDR93201.1 fused signal recognition particle receptor [Enterovirga rhinocerotis]
MALQGRKPGWLLDRILGRRSEEEKPAEPPAPAEPMPAPEPAHGAEPSPLSPASQSEGVPDFTTAAAEVPPAESEPVGDLAGADLAGADLAGADLPAEAGTQADPDIPQAEAPAEGTPPDLGSEGADGGASFEASLREAPQDEAASAPAPPPEEPRRGWFRRLTDGMRRTSSAIGESVTSLFTKKKLDRATLEDLEDVLVGADLGVETATKITQAISAGRYDREIEPAEVKAIMAAEIEKVLAPIAKPLVIDRGRKPFVLLMVGVNGAGKTTTIGKLAQKFRGDGLAVTIAAGDTFRAAAIEQLKVWGERVGAPVIARQQGADAAGLAYDAFEEARGRGADVLMIDTAGRLQNKAGLMAELEKIIRVLRKIDPEAPHAVLLVLDATVGQNALSQVELFSKTAGVTGLVMTKLDGTARGGILVALAAKFGLPVHFIGVGEGVEDLEPFTARDFSRAIAGLE